MRIQRGRAVAGLMVTVGATLLTRCSPGGAPPAAAGAPPFNPVATVDEVMDAIVIPSSQAVFDAVVYRNGELTQSPKTEDEWFSLRSHALGVAEAGNLLMMAPRAKDGGAWMTLARDLNANAMRVVAAAEQKDVEALLVAGGVLYGSCTACHEKYIMAP
jgi:hypothetical protein